MEELIKKIQESEMDEDLKTEITNTIQGMNNALNELNNKVLAYRIVFQDISNK